MVIWVEAISDGYRFPQWPKGKEKRALNHCGSASPESHSHAPLR